MSSAETFTKSAKYGLTGYLTCFGLINKFKDFQNWSAIPDKRSLFQPNEKTLTLLLDFLGENSSGYLHESCL